MEEDFKVILYSDKISYLLACHRVCENFGLNKNIIEAIWSFENLAKYLPSVSS